jgi:hypothetical protein
MPARKLAQIIDESPELRRLVETSRHTGQLQRIYLETVPAELALYGRVGFARGGILCVYADNGAVAAKLRQLVPRMLAHFLRRGWQFNSIRIDVQVDRAPTPVLRGLPKALTPRALDAIRQSAENLPPSPLKDALRKLGRVRRNVR